MSDCGPQGIAGHPGVAAAVIEELTEQAEQAEQAEYSNEKQFAFWEDIAQKDLAKLRKNLARRVEHEPQDRGD